MQVDPAKAFDQPERFRIAGMHRPWIDHPPQLWHFRPCPWLATPPASMMPDAPRDLGLCKIEVRLAPDVRNLQVFVFRNARGPYSELPLDRTPSAFTNPNRECS